MWTVRLTEKIVLTRNLSPLMIYNLLDKGPHLVVGIMTGNIDLLDYILAKCFVFEAKKHTLDVDAVS